MDTDKPSMVVSSMAARLGLTDEQEAMLSKDIGLENLRYSLLLTKVLKSSFRFYSCCMLFALILSAPRHTTGFVGGTAPAPGTNASSASYVALPWRASWVHVPTADAFAFDPKLCLAWSALRGENATGCPAGL